MTLAILEALIKRIQNSGIIGTRKVYLEDAVPEKGPYPQTVISFMSVRPADPSQSGSVRKYSHLFAISSVTQVGTANAMKSAIQEADSIADLLDMKPVTVTLSNGRSVQMHTRLQNGDLSEIANSQEWVAQYTYEIWHD